MRIVHCLAWVAVALACAAPNCDTHDAPLGGSGSSAWARMPSTSSGAPAATTVEAGSAAPHQDVVHAMEAVTGASLDRPKSAAKPTKAKSAASHDGGDYSGGGNYGRTSSSSPPPKPPEPELPESGRKLGVRCYENEQCASNLCEFDVCAKHYSDKLTNGEACNYDHECVSNHCYHDVCE